MVLIRIPFLNICFEGVGSECKHSSKVSVKHLSIFADISSLSLDQFNSMSFLTIY